MARNPSFFLRMMQIAGGLCLLAAVAAAPASADTARSGVCAARLSPEAKAIYDRAAPSVTPATDLAALLKSTVPGMVFEGYVSAKTARTSAVAAYPCLKDLK